MNPNQQITFHPFRLDLGNQRLWREEQAVPLTLKAFALLQYLAERPSQLVTKGELLEAAATGQAGRGPRTALTHLPLVHGRL